MVHYSCLLHHKAALVKNREIWDSTHVITGGQIRVAFSIYLENNGPACHVC